MDIVMDNYIIWIIVAVVIILMTIIGYIAEKTDFGKKEFLKRGKIGKEKIKKSKNKLKETESVEEKNPLEQGLQEENMEAQFPKIQTNEDTTVPVEYTMPNVSSLDQEWNLSSGSNAEPQNMSTLVEEDLNVPLADTKKTEEISEEFNMPEPEKSPVIKRIEEDLNAPFGDNVQEPKGNETNLNLPDIDTVKEEIPFNNEAEDDIWKF